MPKYVDYDTYRSATDKENSEENAFDSLLNEAKHMLTLAAQKFGKLASTREDARCSEVLPSATLQQLQRLAVRNSLNVAKLKMMKGKTGELTLLIDAANSLPMCPALNLASAPNSDARAPSTNTH